MPGQTKHPLYDFEVTPPAATWDFIASRLEDDKVNAPLATKMYDYKLAPPLDAWNTIATELKEPDVGRISPLAPRGDPKVRLNRFAAVAVVTALVIGGWYWLRQPKTVDQILSGGSKPLTNASAAIVTQPETTLTSMGSREKSNTAVFVLKKNNGDKTVFSPVGASLNDKILKYATVSLVPAYKESPILIHSVPIRNQEGAVKRDMDQLTTQDNYLAIVAPNGQLTRISSKFADVIRYLNTEDQPEGYLDRIMNEKSIWKKRFEQWRKKILTSTFIPASTNFLDIFELKDLIDEKE